jgi:hypothetical protein
MAHDAANASQYRCKANDRVQGGNRLGKISWRDALSNEEACT